MLREDVVVVEQLLDERGHFFRECLQKLLNVEVALQQEKLILDRLVDIRYVLAHVF